MYKPIKHLSQRQKRNLRHKIMRSLGNECLLSLPKNSELPNTSHNTPDEAVDNSVLTEKTSPADEGQNDTAAIIENNIDEEFTFSENYSYVSVDSKSECCACSECIINSTLSKITELRQDLKKWAIECHVPLSHISKLLQVLNNYGLELPSDARTLLNTQRKVEITQVEPGEYCHIGLKSGIMRKFETLPIDKIPQKVKININIDGLPLSKSSGSQFWPILGWFPPNLFENLLMYKPFVIGVYHGCHKPESANAFLKFFVDEFLELKEAGLIWQGKRVVVEINAVVCDAPAKSFVSYTKGHTGYHGCSKCIQEGDYIRNRMAFPQLKSTLRTDESFENKLDQDHHLGTSVLEKLGIGMVSQIPLDYMHLVCLGVMKRLLQFWVKGRQDVRIAVRHFEGLDNLMFSFKNYITNDFARKPRRLNDLDRFKATEFRQIVLYTGIVAFKDFLPERNYMNFLHLSCAVRILVSPVLCISLNNCAQHLLETFIKEYGLIYGREYITYNIHNLSHLCNDVLRFGCLDNFSAFIPESHMNFLKKKICIQSAKPLQQLVKRLSEETGVNTHVSEVRINVKQNFIEIHTNSFILTNRHPDNYCLIRNGHYLQVDEIFEQYNDIFIKGKVITPMDSFFRNPIDSRRLGIHLCSKSDDILTASINEVASKCILLPYNDSWVILPLTHKCEAF